MLEKKTLLESKKMLSNETIFRNFNQVITGKGTILWRNLELFKLVGKLFNPINFEFSVRGDYCSSRTEVYELNDTQFVTDAMGILKEHRAIDDSVYKKLDNIAIGKEGSYVLAFGKEAGFDITILPSEYIHNSMTFQPYRDKKVFFKHEPNCDVHPSQVEVSFSVTNQKKQKDFVQMYNRVLKHYQKENAKIIELETE